MPVQHLDEQEADLLAFHFFGIVTLKDVERAIVALAEDATPGISYRSLLVFHGSTGMRHPLVSMRAG